LEGKRWRSERAGESHARATVAITRAMFQAMSTLPTAIYCDVVTLLGTWHDYEGRRTPARIPRSITRQVGTATSSRPSAVTIFYSPQLSTSHRHESRHQRESRRGGHRRRDSMNQRSYSDYCTIRVSIRAPGRVD
jgi:hypothetical protein